MFGFHANQFWNQALDTIKSASSATHFKTEMLKKRLVIKCRCNVSNNERNAKNICSVVDTVNIEWVRVMPSANINSRLLCRQ